MNGRIKLQRFGRGWYSRGRIEQTLRQVLKTCWEGQVGMGRAGQEVAGCGWDWRKRNRKSEVLWALRGERLSIKKSNGSSLLPQL